MTVSSLDLSPGAVHDSVEGPIEVVSHRVHRGRPFMQVLRGDEVVEIPLSEFIASAAIDLDVLAPRGVSPRDTASLAALSSATRESAMEWLNHILDVTVGRPEPGPYCSESTTQPQRKARKADDLGKNVTTIQRKINAYQQRGIAAFIHGNRRTAADQVSLSDEGVVAVLKEVLRDQQAGPRKSAVTLHAMCLAELVNRGLARRGGDPTEGEQALPLATELLSMPRFQRLRSALTGGANPAKDAQATRSSSKRPIKGPLRHEALDFGDEVQIDSTPCDFRVWGPDGEQKVWAVFAVDVATKQSWVRLVLNAPTGMDVSLLLHDVINPQPLTLNSPVESACVVPDRVGVNAWPPNAKSSPPATLPGCIALDHGREGENAHFIALAATLGIELRFGRTMTPTDKAHVESRIRPFAEICQLMPGHKGNAVKNHPERLKFDGLLTFEQACAFFRYWSSWSADQPHTGLPHGVAPRRFLTPNEAHHLSLARGASLRVCADPRLVNAFLPAVALIPHDDGVTSNKVRYWTQDADYTDLIAAASAKGRGREKLTFHYDPNDRSRLLWNKPGSSEWVVLVAKGGSGDAVRPLEDFRLQALLQVPGRTWPSHTELASRRAQLFLDAQSLLTPNQEPTVSSTIASRQVGRAAPALPESAELSRPEPEEPFIITALDLRLGASSEDEC